MRFLAIVFVFFSLSASAVAQDIRKAANVAYGAHAAQRYDVYTQPERGNAPLLIMLHGGAWRTGSKDAVRVWKAKAAHFVPQGYVFASVDTRLLDDGADPRAQAEDFARAIRHIRQNADRWGADAERVVLMGHSAGAHVAALVASDARLRAVSGRLDGVVVLDSGALDVEALMARNPVRLFRRAFGDTPQGWRDASPVAQLDRHAPLFLVLCRARAEFVCDDANRFAATARGLGVIAQVYPVRKSHRAINADLGTPGRYTERVSTWIAQAVR